MTLFLYALSCLLDPLVQLLKISIGTLFLYYKQRVIAGKVLTCCILFFLFYFFNRNIKIKVTTLVNFLYLCRSAADVTVDCIPEMKDEFPSVEKNVSHCSVYSVFSSLTCVSGRVKVAKLTDECLFFLSFFLFSRQTHTFFVTPPHTA